MLKIDQYAYTNRLAGMHPAEKALLAVLTLVVGLVFFTPLVSLSIIAVMAVMTVVRAGIPLRFYCKLMLLPFAFLVLGVFTVALTVAGDGASFLWSVRIGGYAVGVTASGLQQAGELFLKSLGAVSCLYFLSLTTPLVEVLAVLHRMRFPSLLIELMSLVYRFIFVLLETADKIYISQSSRWGYASLKTSYRSLGQLLSSLFGKAYYNSQMLFLALSSRCYTGKLNLLERPLTFSRKNMALIVLLQILLIAIGRLAPAGMGIPWRCTG
ncbi:cobalt ABC transporter, inner membrane subunit CbiQ [Thermacetogenium phaeum DSM 12270]|uniref:Cobalt ABC transporter, inner membrane subunit CbiQ n=1 Tax=Thermacetogenium phaeum (strain ATCC BAA-254 / DSM 26808 / PB) TaxID=1089553 RepID=K4LD88_THEPS|nr:cobalt ECF transporter T component CbiQ [Thermacetogenium phaeum]AFV10758.1 cobalt ABC transporter, inner membrane subunit CbiQ [Thermacetogenium phaeum DSM 12270]